MQSFLELIILFSISIIFFTIIIYPALLFFISWIKPQKFKTNETFEPVITIVISAYNEEDFIEPAINSIFHSGYPQDKIKVLVGVDGSTDNTYNLLKEISKKFNNIDVYEFERAGKNKVLNKLIEKVDTDFIFYMDADLRILPGTLNKMVSYFFDEKVGLVMASVKIEDLSDDDNTGRMGETLYQKYETLIRTSETFTYSSINSLGTLYGLRKSCYKPIPNDLVCDDFWNVLYTNFMKKKVIFIKDIHVTEIRRKSLNMELFRRIRLVAGGLATIWEIKHILSLNYFPVSFFIWVHKILRWFTPLFLLIIFLCTLLLPNESPYKMPLLIIQSIFYLFGFMGWIAEKLKIKIELYRMALYIITMNIGFALGIIRFLRKKQNAVWDRSGLVDL